MSSAHLYEKVDADGKPSENFLERGLFLENGYAKANEVSVPSRCQD